MITGVTAFKSPDIAHIELYSSSARQMSFDHGIDMGRLLVFINGELADEAAYMTWWQRVDEEGYPWKINTQMIAESTSDDDKPLDVDSAIMQE